MSAVPKSTETDTDKPSQSWKLKTCPICRSLFNQRVSTKRACSLPCQMELKRQRALKKAKREERRQDREKLIKLRTARDWIKLAQAEFSKYVRERDKDEPCISCGCFSAPGVFTGGGFDCGHYLSVGSHPELRFDERNAHRQCKSCNGGGGRFKRSERTVSAKYREGLVARIGAEAVEWLEGPHEPKRYRIPELIEIRDRYRAKVKELRAEYLRETDVW